MRWFLSTAQGLILDGAIAQFTSADAAVLTLAVLLHDAALHISEAGFRALIKGSASNQRIESLDLTTWPELWDNFLFAARRWDDEKIIDVLGQRDDGTPRANIRDPFDHYDNLTEGDRRLIGEFVRQHHPRLAHEFANYGIPSSSTNWIRPSARFGDLADLAGVVARSHGIPLRACLDYLQEKYHRREYRSVHAPYLMCLLRIADYLQIEPERAPAIVFRYKDVPSPVSRLEHRVHQAVVNVTRTHDDPESLEIQARPADVQSFLRLREWLGGIQAELDASWAVLGEVYGRDSLLKNLGLSIRRIRSNLDDPRAFAKQESIDYVPERIRFDVARAELLTLMVRPLYGDHPEIGVRELLQNALDAVRERVRYCEMHPGVVDVPLRNQGADVEVWLDDLDVNGFATLTVSDRGIGMTEEVVKRYLLRAGASYRYSEAWRRAFEVETSSGASAAIPRSTVLRSGRFGIGILAAFLLGSEIEVRTRHMSSPVGLSFVTTLHAGLVAIKYDDSLKVGTEVRVRVPAAIHAQLISSRYQFEGQDSKVTAPAWDWYCLSTPQVQRLLGRSRKILPQGATLPNSGEGLPSGSAWRRLTAQGYEAIYWAFDGRVPALACNGIRVEGFSFEMRMLAPFRRSLAGNSFVSVATPHVSVFDPDGNLPLTLQRDTLATERFPFHSELAADVLKDLFAYMLVHIPEAPADAPLAMLPRYPGLLPQSLHHRVQARPWFGTADGIGILDPPLLRETSPQGVMFVTSYQAFSTGKLPPLKNSLGAAVTVDMGRASNDARLGCFRGMAELFLKSRSLFPRPVISAGGVRILTSRKMADLVARSALPKFIHREIGSPIQIGEWVAWTIGRCGATWVDFAALERSVPADSEGEETPFVAELYFAQGGQEEESVLTRAWHGIFGPNVIPFNSTKRHKQQASAYKLLRDYIARWK